MLTVAEAAVHARVSEAMIRQWVAEGTLPHYRLGAKGKRGKIMIEESDLDGVLASFKVGPKEQGAARKPAPTPKPVLRHIRLS
jgi:excisionase family DNA binding protein